jgi:hypothetical protein
LGLFEVDYRDKQVRDWSALASNMIGVSAPKPPYNHVGMLIPWWRSRVLELTALIEERAGVAWQVALGRQPRFSEYTLYGTFVRHSLGLEEARHFADSRMLIQTSWHKDTSSARGLEDIFNGARGETVGVMIHSKDRIDPDLYADYARARWQEI